MTGRELRLRRADPEALKLYAASVQLYHLHLYVDMAGKMNMLKYSFSDFLDSMGAFRGVARKPAAPATVRVRFTLSAAQPSVVTVPEGTKVSDGGGIFFSTDEAAEIAAGDMHVDIPCTCQAAGVGGNGILAGAVNTVAAHLFWLQINLIDCHRINRYNDISIEKEKVPEHLFFCRDKRSGTIFKHGYYIKIRNRIQ